MNHKSASPIRPFLLQGTRGYLLAIYYPPAAGVQPLGDVIVAPAFAEEMNRCRAMVAMQARRFAEIGVGTLVLDPYGTGDSSGEFSDASWSQWRDDLQRGIAWLREHANGCTTVWGIRLGAAMAAELAALDPALDKLLLWQPVTQGKLFFTQFLRIRVAADLEQPNGIKTTDELRRQSAQGQLIEISGYSVGSQLARELDEVRLPPVAQLQGKRVLWFETLASADASVTTASTKTIETLQAAGVAVQLHSVIGPAFWQVHERMDAPELLQSTTDAARTWFEQRAGSDRLQKTESPTAIEAADIQPTVITCDNEHLMAVMHRGKPGVRRGVVGVVAGGPQYRSGAHRQFVSLARQLAGRGHPVLRFDLKGMGDSTGNHVGFQQSEADIRAAIDQLVMLNPGLDEIVLFGECESASGILFYAYRDVRVKGIVLVNPWVRTEGGRAEVIIKHYYLERIMSADFWRKVVFGKFNPFASLASFADVLRTYLSGRSANRRAAQLVDDISDLPLPQKTAAGLRRFTGKTLIMMSGRDYIAREFDQVVKHSDAWQGLLQNPNVQRHDLADADHTFSRAVWKAEAAKLIGDWVGSW